MCLQRSVGTKKQSSPSFLLPEVMGTETGAKCWGLAGISATMQCTASEGNWSSKDFLAVPLSSSSSPNTKKKKNVLNSTSSIGNFGFNFFNYCKNDQRDCTLSCRLPIPFLDGLQQKSIKAGTTSPWPTCCSCSRSIRSHSAGGKYCEAKGCTVWNGISWIIRACVFQQRCTWSILLFGNCTEPVTVTCNMWQLGVANPAKHSCSLTACFQSLWV